MKKIYILGILSLASSVTFSAKPQESTIGITKAAHEGAKIGSALVLEAPFKLLLQGAEGIVINTSDALDWARQKTSNMTLDERISFIVGMFSAYIVQIIAWESGVRGFPESNLLQLAALAAEITSSFQIGTILTSIIMELLIPHNTSISSPREKELIDHYNSSCEF